MTIDPKLLRRNDFASHWAHWSPLERVLFKAIDEGRPTPRTMTAIRAIAFQAKLPVPTRDEVQVAIDRLDAHGFWPAADRLALGEEP